MRALLGRDGLGAVGEDFDHAAAGVRGSEGAVALGEDVFGTLKIVADVLQGGFVELEVKDGIGFGQRRFRRP